MPRFIHQAKRAMGASPFDAGMAWHERKCINQPLNRSAAGLLWSKKYMIQKITIHRSGNMYIAPEQSHLLLRESGKKTPAISENPYQLNYRPSTVAAQEKDN
jgi:hypothetical protein